MRMELSAERIGKLRKVVHYNGLPIDARSITDEILMQEGKNGEALGFGLWALGTTAAGQRDRP
jgi:hypothetical protein